MSFEQLALALLVSERCALRANENRVMAFEEGYAVLRARPSGDPIDIRLYLAARYELHGRAGKVLISNGIAVAKEILIVFPLE